jgi:hypothetical protein
MSHGQLDLFDPAVAHASAASGRRGARRPRRRNELLDVAHTALVVARRQLNDYSCPKSKHTFTQPQLLACLVLRAYRKLTYRGTAELLDAGDALREVLGLTHAPAHTTLKEFERRVVTPALLDALVGRVLATLVGHGGLAVAELAVDTTGVETTSASAHFRSRARRTRRSYVKPSLAVACTSIVLVSMAVGMGPADDLGGDTRAMLWRAAPRCAPDWALADSGFDAEWFHPFCRAAWGAASHVPPVPKTKGGTARSGPDRVRCAAHTPYLYGKRWHVEGFISGMKRTCGPTLAARSERSLFNEAALKALAYAIPR